MSSQALRELVNTHKDSTTILAALGTALDAKETGTPLHPAIQARIAEVLDALEIDGMTEGVNAVDCGRMLAEIRFGMLLDAKLLLSSTRSLSWTHTETEILQAGGEVSAGFAPALTQTIVPQLEGLSRRLGSPEGSFLDVGAGAAGPLDRDGAPLAVFERGRHRSLGAVPGARARERADGWPHRPHPVKATGG